MKLEFSQNLKVLSSQTDIFTEVGSLQYLTLAQDNICNFLKTINCDGVYLVERHNLFFVMTRTKLKVFKNLKWLDNFKMTSNFIKITKIRIEIETSFYDETNNLCAVCVHEICPVDYIQRSIRPIDDTFFPKDIEVEVGKGVVLDKLNFDENDCDKFVSRVYPTNIDFYRHMNNLEYVRMYLNYLPEDFYEKSRINELQINYIKEISIGEEFQIVRILGNNCVNFKILKDENMVNICRFNYKPRD